MATATLAKNPAGSFLSDSYGLETTLFRLESNYF